VTDPRTLARASDLGLAFQLTNIARDIVEDAEGGRCYLPQAWLRRRGLAPEEVADPAFGERVFPLVRELVDAAEPYYASAAIGIRALPLRAAWAIATARSVYRDIGRARVRAGPTGLARRVFTGRGRKGWRVVTGGARVLGSRVPRRRAQARSGLWTPAALTGPAS
jgi:phytoene synthase